MAELLLTGVALVALAVILARSAYQQTRLARQTAATPLTPVAELRALHEKVAAQIGSDLFAQRVALAGLLECDEPLTAPLSQMKSAAFRYRVTRRWEEEYEERDDAGKLCRRVRSGSEIVATNERRVRFRLRDGGGELLVDPEGARLDMEKVIDHFEPGESDGTPRFGALVLNLGQWGTRPRRITLGYHSHEEIVPLGREVYVLGMATDRDGVLCVVRSPEPDEPFLVSLHTRRQVVAQARAAITRSLVGAAVCGPLGIALLLFGALSRR
ncbi:MAG TPA: GIDE domain-containing protein [Chloroflexota bacterium]|nr:GIDE domain-containing protein [Chloroflexota bacterium]